MSRNKGNTGGQGLFTDTATVNFTQVEISHGIAGEGGAVGFRKESKGNFESCRITNNTVSDISFWL